jgi:hypothetical protein
MDFAAGVYLSEAPSPPMTPYSPLTHCIRVYCILIHTAKGGGGEFKTERRLEGQQFTKPGRKYEHDLNYLQLVKDLSHKRCS